MNKAELRQLWVERLDHCQESGLTMKEWCASTGHSYDRLQYWKKRIQATSGSNWLPVSVLKDEVESLPMPHPTPEPTLTLQIQHGSLRIDVYAGAQQEMLQEVLRAWVTPC